MGIFSRKAEAPPSQASSAFNPQSCDRPSISAPVPVQQALPFPVQAPPVPVQHAPSKWEVSSSKAKGKAPQPGTAQTAIDLQSLNDTYPSSEAEAKQHITKIREEKGLHGTDSNISDLQAALKVLSEQLYQQSTHFLLELIQNVDDNTYEPSDQPTLTITYWGRTLRIDCNERGFSRRNVAAISRIGQSSKTNRDQSRTYIGEKGIGFKSVFRVANVVWIHSGHYSFKFDKRERLGMIAPVWASFPQRSHPGLTSILLELSDECDFSELLRELKSLNPRLLMFLQRLKKINMRIHEDGKKPWATDLVREDEPISPDGQQCVILHQERQHLSYNISYLRAKELPYDPKRDGISQSDILLAFPLARPGVPMIQSQKVYAYLPIRDYGFKFLLQADFLLIASREDIDSSSPWNSALLRHIPRAFHKAVKQFNAGDLRYSWLPYLPLRPYVGDFFAHLQDDILELLAHSPVLESCDGILMPPTRLIYVPQNFTDEHNEPLILTPQTKSKYLSNRYSRADAARMSHLGVHTLSSEAFVNHLQEFVLNNPSEFEAKPDIWHSRLAEVLLPSVVGSKVMLDKIANLKIIPLRSGQWACAKDGNLLFPSRTSSLVVPEGLDFLEIAPEAEQNNFRRQLCMAMGAREFEALHISEIIVRTHENTNFQPSTQTNTALISQITFLYQADWKNVEKRDVWFVTETGNYRKGSEIYIDSEVKHSATKMFANIRETIPFLHESYIKTAQNVCTGEDLAFDQVHWSRWLARNLNVSQIPRISTPPNKAPFKLSNNFQFLIETLDSSKLLILLRDNWDIYSRWALPREDPRAKAVGWELSARRLNKKLATVAVTCRSGSKSPLNQTFLPIGTEQWENLVPIPFLDLPDPHNDEWSCLRHFGVTMEQDAHFFIKCLGQLQKQKTTKAQVSRLYEHCRHMTTNDNSESVRQAFEEQKLIFWPDETAQTGGHWYGLNDCVWNGPKCLKATPSLSALYSEHHWLMQGVLRIKDADITTLVYEAQQIMPDDSRDYISEVLIAVSKYFELSCSASSVKSLTEHSIFPIGSKSVYHGFDSLRTAADQEIWFIADRQHLRENFEGHVDLLALEPDVVQTIRPLISALNLDQRLLSNAAKGISKPEGQIKKHMEYTKCLQSKARSIARLVSKESSKRSAIFSQLQKIQVHQSERVIVEWVVKSTTGELHKGQAESGRVVLEPIKGGLQIYLTVEDINANLPPLELQEEFAAFAEIKEPNHFTLLLYILAQNDLQLIADTLLRRGVPLELYDFDVLVDINKGPDPQKPKKNTEPIPMPKQQTHVPVRLRKTEKPYIARKDDSELENFIQRVKRQSARKQNRDTWAVSDAFLFFSKICRLEGQEAVSLLPRPVSDHENGREEGVRAFINTQTSPWPVVYEASEEEGKNFLTVPVRRKLDIGSIDEETRYIGELSISTFLSSHLRNAFVPSKHWTSALRSRAGYMPYQKSATNCSTFTLDDSNASFAGLLLKLGYEPARAWTKNWNWSESCRFHIEVVVSAGDLSSTFSLHPAQIEMARDCYLSSQGPGAPKKVFLIACVYDIYNEPATALFVDPWALHIQGALHLLAHSPYDAKFNDVSMALRTINAVLPTRVESPKDAQRARARLIPAAKAKAKSKAGGQPAPPDCASDSVAYCYKQLRNHREIRLLELAPGLDEMSLSGRVIHVSIDDPGIFWAVSYVWGAAIKPMEFATPDGNIPLTVSLHSALHAIRDKDMPILLWADAVCIDQSSEIEKKVQIRLLRTIFQSAEGVVAWIGKDDESTDRALETMLQIRMIALKTKPWPKHLQAIPLSWSGKDTPSLSDTVWKDIDSLLDKEYFRRSWIIQELVLASHVKVFCGRWTLNWEDFFQALQICRDTVLGASNMKQAEHKLLQNSDPAYFLGVTRHSRQSLSDLLFSRKCSLLDLLDIFSYTRATKEHDKLFSLLGLTSYSEVVVSSSNGQAKYGVNTANIAFDPDYESTIETVTRRYAQEFVRQGYGMELLRKSGSTKAYDFCSWIPAWTHGIKLQTISNWRANYGVFNAGKGKESSITLHPSDSKVLIAKGFAFDKITKLSGVQSEKVDIVTFIASIHALIDTLKQNSYPTAEQKPDLKLYLPIGAAFRPYIEPTIEQRIDHESAAKQTPEHWPLNLKEKIPAISSMHDITNFFAKSPPEQRDVLWGYWHTAAAFAKKLTNATACTTAKGYIGLVPGSAKQGDLVCILHGSNAPLILRKETGHRLQAGNLEEDADVYTLVGEAYIHGVMHGEAMELKHVEAKKFYIV